jgi:hypothetical protein
MPTIDCKRAEPPEPGICDDAEIARQRQLETHAEAEAAIGRDYRLGAARGRRDVPGELRYVLRRGFQKALDVAAARKMLALRAHNDHAHAVVLVEGFEHGAQLVACVHRNDVERRPMQDDVRALALRVDFDREAVEVLQQRLAAMVEVTHCVTPWWLR